MGNSGSHHPPVPQEGVPPQNWAHSFPRDPQRTSHLKVLPDLDASARLRITNNGAILHSGGTISGRKGPDGSIHRSKSVSSPNHPQLPPHRDPNHRYQPHAHQDPNSFNLQAKRFGSEPDLRVSNEEYNAGARHRISREKKKKTKAPAPPPQDGSSPESLRYGWESAPKPLPPVEPPRRLRLFKTRAESKKNLKREEEDRREERYLRDRSMSNEEPNTRVDGRSFAKEEVNRRRSDETSYTRTSDREGRSQDRVPEQKNDRRYDRQDSDYRRERIEEGRIQQKIRPEFRRQKSFDHSLVQDMYERRELEARFEKTKSQIIKNIDHGDGGVMIRNRDRQVELQKPSQRMSSPNVLENKLSSREFQQELLMATKLRSKANADRARPILETKIQTEENDEEKISTTFQVKHSKSKMTTMDLSKRESYKEKYRGRNEYIHEEPNNIKSTEIRERGQPSGKESSPVESPGRGQADQPWESTPIIKPIQERPPKTFYFGMDETELQHSVTDPRQEDVVDRFAASLMHRNRPKLPPGSSESAVSSEPEDDMHLHEGNIHGIDLQLRPTLPKKQLEIPRFSPAAAWRLLSSIEGHEIHSTHEDIAVLEVRIEELAQPMRAGTSHDNKSGDSGISGDAGPPELLESPGTTTQVPLPNIKGIRNRPPLATWTPQQDLGEESSSDGGMDSPESAPSNKIPTTITNRGHVFSLSLPRENHLASYTDCDKGKQSFNSLQKIRRSVSGALGVLITAPRNAESNSNGGSGGSSVPAGTGNWFLSRSAPTSLDNCQMSPAHDKSSGSPSDQDEDTRPLVPQRPFSYLQNHMMYLPEYTQHKNKQNIPKSSKHYSEESWYQKKIDTNKNIINYSKYEYEHNNERDNEKFNGEYDVELRHKKNSYLDKEERLLRTKSKEEISSGGRKLSTFSKSCENISRGLEDLQDPPLDQNLPETKKTRSKGRRFTFQSTVRQIERRRLAEKLSKEAEQKEKQRKGELEAMRRVEEEFQKKRAREKASIRQQLRLYSLEESNCTSLPSEWSPTRADPDGAVSSPASSPTSPQGSELQTSKHQHNSRQYQQKHSDSKSNKKYELSQQYSSDYEKQHESRNARKNNAYDLNSSNEVQNDNGYKKSFSYQENIGQKKEVLKRQDNINIKTDQQTPYISKLVEQRSSHRRERQRMPTTEILSEFHDPRSTYLEYKGRIESPTVMQTIHPQIVCHIPSRSPQAFHPDGPPTPQSGKYRKHFPRGRSVGSSDSELSVPSVSARRPLRSRSASPVQIKTGTETVAQEEGEEDKPLQTTTNNDAKITKKKKNNANQLTKELVEQLDDALIIPTLKVRPISLGLGSSARPFAPPTGFRSILFSPQAVE